MIFFSFSSDESESESYDKEVDSDVRKSRLIKPKYIVLLPQGKDIEDGHSKYIFFFLYLFIYLLLLLLYSFENKF